VANYTPIALPGQTFTFQSSGTAVGGDLAVVSGSGTVAKASTLASHAVVGVFNHDTAAGAKVAVTVGKPIHESVADGAITAGDELTTTNTANRQVKALAASAADLGAAYDQTAANTAVNDALNAARAVIGTALTDAIDNAVVRWVQR
jgi:hypothetical protein